MTDEMPRVLIEDWLPIADLSAASIRERTSMTALPPTYYLHVWWARRPLITSRAAVLASVLPSWSLNWPKHLLNRFPGREEYLQWFIHLAGIHDNPAEGQKLIRWAKSKGIKLKVNPYGDAPRAFEVNPSSDDLETLNTLIELTWDQGELRVLDPFAGGGSIPFEALRYGFETIAVDLNPVAATVLKATLDYPARYGPTFATEIGNWGGIWATDVRKELESFFPTQRSENIFAYLWARTVACPTTGKPIPLSPNWWLSRGKNPAAVHLVANADMAEPQYVIVTGKEIRDYQPDEGTLSRGGARSPWTGETVSSDYIKTEAQAGRMGHELFAVAVKTHHELHFRVPTASDLAAVRLAEAELVRARPKWISRDLIPVERFPPGNDNRPLLYGMNTWTDFFSPRQLLVMGTYVEAIRKLEARIRDEVDGPEADALIVFMGMALDKCLNYNSLLASWHASRGVVRSVFDRHDFSFKWTYAEFDGATNLPPWAVGQVVKAYRELGELSSPAQISFWNLRQTKPVDRLRVYQNSANNLEHLEDNSVHNITVDPPYYDNVQYAELSDYFYVWLKRSVGHILPQFFVDELTNKDEEAVANPARFEPMGRKKKQLAEQDYERKMAAAFREMHRVLHPHGVLTVMFTHKRVEAWDTLATALIGAGFVIKASWPVHTESEHSLHQAQKNAAASTILLVCRKRAPSDDGAVWWDDIQGQVRRVAREKALEYAAQGIGGVDLYISTFGPTLSVISENWPVLTSTLDPKTGEPIPLQPDTALDLAREEVIHLRKEGLLAGKAIEFDAVTDWYLMAWDAFKAEQFPYDEARKLAIALDVEVDATLMRTKRLVTKSGEYVVLQKPAQRRKKGMVDPDASVFEHLIDALHTAMMIYDEDGAGACDVFLMNRGLKHDTTFKAGLQALINAIPRTKVKNKFVRPEADILDRMRLAFYADELTVPPEEEPVLPRPEQLGLFDGEFEEDFQDEEEEDEGEA